MARVIIGIDPHKRSATIEIIDDREKVLTQGRFGTDRDGGAMSGSDQSVRRRDSVFDRLRVAVEE